MDLQLQPHTRDPYYMEHKMALLPRVWRTKTKRRRSRTVPGSSMASKERRIRAFVLRSGRGQQEGDGGGLEEAGVWGDE